MIYLESLPHLKAIITEAWEAMLDEYIKVYIIAGTGVVKLLSTLRVALVSIRP